VYATSAHSEGTDTSAVDTAADSNTELSHKQHVTATNAASGPVNSSSDSSVLHATNNSVSSSAAVAASAAQLALDSQAEAALSAQAALLLAAQERRRASVQAAIDELDAILLDGEPRPAAKVRSSCLYCCFMCALPHVIGTSVESREHAVLTRYIIVRAT
jgi:hypothetical protein